MTVDQTIEDLERIISALRALKAKYPGVKIASASTHWMHYLDGISLEDDVGIPGAVDYETEKYTWYQAVVEGVPVRWAIPAEEAAS